MRCTKVLSGLVLTGMLAAFATGQDKPKPVEKPLEVLRVEAAKLFLADVVKPEPTIANIVANHPDVKLAEAKLQVAKAELDQARLLITQKYTIAQAKLEDAKVQLSFAEKRMKSMELLRGNGVASSEIGVVEQLLSQAKSTVVIAEAEQKALQGATNLRAEITFDVGSVEGRPLFGDPVVFKGAQWLPKPTTQSAKLREVLERKVALDLPKPLPLDELMAIFLPKTGLDAFLVRYPEWASAKKLKQPPMIYLPQSEQTVAAWLQLTMDEFNSQFTDNVPENYRGKYEIYVRDYGLLFAKATMAPQGALRLEEFMRIPPVVEAPKEAPK